MGRGTDQAGNQGDAEARSEAGAEPGMERAAEILALGERQRLSLPERDAEIGLIDWGGTGPVALLHHANGFCKGVLGPLAMQLREHFHVYAMDARGHGDSTPPPPGAVFRWAEFARDVVAVAEHLVDRHGAPVALGLGHSFGGTSMLGAASRRPELFEKLVLVDPVTPVPSVSAPAEPPNDLIEKAQKRRADWPTRIEAREWWQERPLFEEWLPEAIDLYALDGLRDRPDGSVELKCSPVVESAVFQTGWTVDVTALAYGMTTPTLWLWARHGNFAREGYERLAASMASARVETLDAGHLVAMERPELVSASTLAFVAPSD